MDSFEHVRCDAHRLHEEAVERGADPMQPQSIIDAAVAHLNLEVAWLPKDDPTLFGAHALYDESSGTIRCAECDDPIERALIVAHEIGHARVHPSGTTCTADHVDPSRATEAAPVGLQRVEDYGARERRELQADVYARELLFPREVARRMHLVEKRTASSIREKINLPINLIRQQILDAVLLPEVVEVLRSDKGEKRTPDSSQARAAAHRGNAFLLQAGPGTGKTSTLIQRVAGLLEDGVDPAELLILTFSNRAAGELVDRIGELAPQAAPRIWTGTFHAFGLDLIRRYHDRLALGPDPSLFDRSDAVELLEEILPTLDLRHYRDIWDPSRILREVISAISRAKDELVGPEHYRKLGEAMISRALDPESRVAAEKSLEVAKVYALYESELRRKGAVDFGDLIMRPTLLLESDSIVTETVRSRHRHVLVDEYQDVNRASTRMLQAVAGGGENLWVVGDSRQAIYRFRGASSQNLSDFGSLYPKSETDALEVNYRSTSEVVEAFTQFSREMRASDGMLPLRVTANRGHGDIPQIKAYETEEIEFDGIATNILDLEKSGVALRDQAVLCRTNARLNRVAAHLEARGIPVLHLGSLFERDEIRDLLALMSLAVDSMGVGLVRVATIDRYRLNAVDLTVALKALQEGDGTAVDKLASIAGLSALSRDGRASLTRLATDLDGTGLSTSPWEFLTSWLMDRSRYLAGVAAAPQLAGKLRGIAIWQLVNFVRDQGKGLRWPPIGHLLDRIRQLVLFADERDLRQVPAAAMHFDAVRLMTVHGSKGLEFEAVHLPGLNVKSFPSAWKGVRCPPPVGLIGADEDVEAAIKADHGLEEECLFFVAMSRSRRHLTVTHYRKKNGRNSSESPYLEGLVGVANRIDRPRLEAFPTLPKEGEVNVRWPEGWRITSDLLSSYDSCPRRFFYTHVVGLKASAKATAFDRTHRCLSQLVNWLVDARAKAEVAEATVFEEFERIWNEGGPTDHAYSKEYRDLAGQLIQSLVGTGQGRQFQASVPIHLNLSTGTIWVRPDEVSVLPNGTLTLRRVRTGRKRSDEYTRLEYVLYENAGRAQYPGGFTLEAVHLADGIVETAVVKAARVQSGRDASAHMLGALRAGLFAADPDPFRCSRCPHFFICDAAPEGVFEPPVQETSGL